MRYIDKTLLSTEKLIYFTRPHWIVFASALGALVVAFIFWHVGPMYIQTQSFIFQNLSFVDLLSLLALILSAYWFLKAYIVYRFSEYAVTDRRVILKEGWIRRRALEIFLRKLEGIDVDQTVMGRILGYGTLIIIGTGGTQDHYYNIPDPFKFRKIIQRQTDLLIDEEDYGK